MNKTRFLELIEKNDPSAKLEIETAVEDKVIGNIRIRQSRHALSGNGYYTHIGPLTKGCQACLSGRLLYIRNTTKCNLNCKFCYHYNKTLTEIPKDRFLIIPHYYTERDVRVMFEAHPDTYDAVAWIYREALLEMDKMLPLMKYFAKNGLHQYTFTNGIVVDEEMLKILLDSGLNEIRFDLASTMCSDLTLRKIEMARKYFDCVVVESPMFTEYFNAFVANRKKILAAGITHLHLPELQLQPNMGTNFIDEGFIYRYHLGYTSPIVSRQMVYDLLDIARDEKWDITLLDCSNELKFYRGIKGGKFFNQVDYRNETNGDHPDLFHLSNKWYIDALDYLQV